MRIGFIGTGGIARQHARGLAKRDDVTFVGAYDVVRDKSQSFAAEYGGDACSSAAEMLDTAKPDAVWVCVPPFAHGDAENALIERRIPFCVEKPISNAMDTSRRILEGIEGAGLLTSVCYMNRYRRGVNRAKELLATDPAVLIHGGWIGGTPGVYWWRQQALSGGQILEQTTHIFDVVRYLGRECQGILAVQAIRCRGAEFLAPYRHDGHRTHAFADALPTDNPAAGASDDGGVGAGGPCRGDGLGEVVSDRRMDNEKIAGVAGVPQGQFDALGCRLLAVYGRTQAGRELKHTPILPTYSASRPASIAVS